MGKEGDIIPAKTGKTICFVLNPTEQVIINTVALDILKKTGTYSKSEAARQLIAAGAKAMGIKVQDAR